MFSLSLPQSVYAGWGFLLYTAGVGASALTTNDYRRVVVRKLETVRLCGFCAGLNREMRLRFFLPKYKNPGKSVGIYRENRLRAVAL